MDRVRWRWACVAAAVAQAGADQSGLPGIAVEVDQLPAVIVGDGVRRVQAASFGFDSPTS
jgi:hypothetical protein